MQEKTNIEGCWFPNEREVRKVGLLVLLKLLKRKVNIISHFKMSIYTEGGSRLDSIKRWEYFYYDCMFQTKESRVSFNPTPEVNCYTQYNEEKSQNLKRKRTRKNKSSRQPIPSNCTYKLWGRKFRSTFWVVKVCIDFAI